MSRESILSGGGEPIFVSETGTRQAILATVYLNETGASGEGSGAGTSVATGVGVGESLFTSSATGIVVGTGLAVGVSLFSGVGSGISVATGTGISPSVVTAEGFGTAVATGLGVGESTGGEVYFGGGGYPVYGKFVRPKSIKDILDVAMEDIYEEATKKNVPQETRLEFAKVVKPFTESKAKVPDSENIDWVALQKDAARVDKLLKLWQQQLDDDDQVILKAYEQFY